MRDDILKVLYRVSEIYGGEPEARARHVDKLLELSVAFVADQVFIKVAFEHGDRTGCYDKLYEQTDAWGHDFLVLSMRVIYILE